jgi:hypothetical protein
MRRHAPFALVLLCLVSSGCETMQWLAPHQLWKLNREPQVGGEDGYFSIPSQPLRPTGANSSVRHAEEPAALKSIR